MSCSGTRTFRGRLIPAHVRANAVRADRFYVRYPEFDRDAIINRVLAAALDILTHQTLRPVVDELLRRQNHVSSSVQAGLELTATAV